MFNGNNLPHELLLAIMQTTKLRNVIKNSMSTGVKLSKDQISKIILAPLGITAAASAIDAGIQKKIHGSGTTTLTISNKEMDDILKIVQALENSNILLKGIAKKIEHETKEEKGGFLGMPLGTLEASLLGKMLTGKGGLRPGYGNKKEKVC